MLRGLALLLAWGFSELVSYVILCLQLGGVVSYGDLQAERQKAIDATLSGMAELDDELRGPRRSSNQIVHPYLGYVLDPEDLPIGFTSGPSVAALGFHASPADLLLSREKNEVVIAILGGSVAAELGEVGGSALAERLGASQRFRGRTIKILNLALEGFKQPQQLMTLGYFLSLGVTIDIVINLDGFNEVVLPAVENQSAGVFASFPRGWQFRVGLRDPALRRAIGRISYMQDRRLSQARWFSRRPVRYSMLATLVWRILDSRAAWQITDEMLRKSKAGEAASTHRNYEAFGPPQHYADREMMFDDLVALWRRCSLQMDRLCRGLDIEYYHCLQPNQYVDGSKELTIDELSVAWREDHPYRPAVVIGYPLLIAAGAELRAKGVEFHDMTQVFANVRETLYKDACCHFNDRGNEILAHAMAQILADH